MPNDIPNRTVRSSRRSSIRVWIIAAVSAAMLAPGQGSAAEMLPGRYFLTGNDLHEYCQDRAYGVACIYYVQGIIDGGVHLNRVGKNQLIIISGFRHCSSDNVTGGQLRDVVKRYLEEHPERRHWAAANIVGEALEEAFPCPK